MSIPTRLTIQDYFKQRAYGASQPTKCAKAATDAGAASGDASFSKTLAGVQASSDLRSRGMSIRDYMQKRITSHTPHAIAKVSSTAAPMETPIASSSAEAAVHNTASNAKVPQSASPRLKIPHKTAQVEDRRKILASIEQAATHFGLPAALIEAVVKAESNYQVRALSPAGAQGLMQLMPATARELGVTDPFDIDQNIRAGAQYLRNMLDKFGGDLHLALSAYNAGPGTVERYAGNVPYAETRSYVQRVLRYAEQFSSPEVT